MQYLIGFVYAIILVYIVAKLQFKYNILNEFSIKSFMPKQSDRHNLFLLFDLPQKNKKVDVKKQSKIHNSKTNIKVIIMENQAYWIKDNVFYTADMYEGSVDKDTTREVDTMTMDSVQLDKMIFIIDRLREEAFDDRWGSGN